MQGSRILHLVIATLVLLPASGCLETGGERTRTYGEPCPQQVTWNQPGVYERLADEGAVQGPAAGLGFNSSSTSLPEDLELRSAKWQLPAQDSPVPLQLQLGVHRFDAEVTLLEAIVPEDREDELGILARSFVENVTGEEGDAVDETVGSWLANEKGTAVQASPDGTHVNVTGYETPVEGPFRLEEIVQRLDLERRPGSADLASFVLDGAEWRFGGTTAIAHDTVAVDNRSVEIQANAFDDVAVNFADGTTDVAPPAGLINITFERLGLPHPDPGPWASGDPCSGDGEQPRVPSWLGG